MGRKAKLLQCRPHLVIVVAFIQAHPLRLLFCRRGSLHHYALHGGAHQFHIVTIGSVHHQPNRYPVTLRQQGAFHSRFAPVGRIGTGFFPRPVALWSSPRPCSTTPNQVPAIHQTVLSLLALLALLATVLGRHQLAPTLGSGRVRWTWDTNRSGSTLPIGSLYAARKRWRRHSADPPREAVHPRSGGDSHERAAKAEGQPTVRPKSEMRNPEVVGLLGVRSRVRCNVIGSFILLLYHVIRIGS
jgi:hypothetical protein